MQVLTHALYLHKIFTRFAIKQHLKLDAKSFLARFVSTCYNVTRIDSGALMEHSLVKRTGESFVHLAR